MTEPENVMHQFNTLCAAPIYFFPGRGKINVSSKHGVYIIYNENNVVLHVGMTPYGKEGLNQRLYNHISSTGVFYREYIKPNNLVMRGICKFRFIEIENPRTRAFVEALAAGLLCPAHFGTGVKRSVENVALTI